MGKVPALKHGDTVITEVAAICTYLADEFPQKKLNVPVGTPRRGVYLKWLFFGPGCIEPAVIDRAAPRKEEARRGMLSYGDFDTTMNVVAKAVAQGPWLMGEQFTAADVVIGSNIRWGMMFKLDPGAAGVRRLCGADRGASGGQARRREGRQAQGGVRDLRACGRFNSRRSRARLGGDPQGRTPMAVVDPRIAGKPVPRISKATMERDSVARAKSARGMEPAFLDQRIPRYEREIINMVGMGVTENAALRPNVTTGAAGFSVTYVRAKSGKGAALHRHATEEVFIPVKGPWQVFWLEGDEERTVDLDEGDVVNVPIGIYRGFRSLSDRPDALLMAIVGGPDAGKVDWHPSVLAEARSTGLSVDDDGNLVIDKPAA